jgi:hypothetical protein
VLKRKGDGFKKRQLFADADGTIMQV